eukprot:UN01415
MFRNTAALRFAQQAASSKIKQSSYTKALFTDTGNIPLVIANSAGGALVLTFGLRKLFYHPDISVSDELRKSNEVENETPLRLEDADSFRTQTRRFAAWIEPKGLQTVKLLTGAQDVESVSPKWDLTFTKTDVKEMIPLERTNFFDDGLYEETSPSDYASLEQQPEKFTHKAQKGYYKNLSAPSL